MSVWLVCGLKAQLKDSQHDIDAMTIARDEAMSAAKEADRKYKASEADLRQLQDDFASSERARKAAQSERDDLLEELNTGSSARLVFFSEAHRCEQLTKGCYAAFALIVRQNYGGTWL